MTTTELKKGNATPEDSKKQSKPRKASPEKFSPSYYFMEEYHKDIAAKTINSEYRTFVESVDEKDPSIYEWKGNHWSKACIDHLITYAQKKLKIVSRSNYSRSAASACIDTLKGEIEKFNIYDIKKDRENIIPLSNAWLTIKEVNGENGKEVNFVLTEPDKSKPIRYFIDTEIELLGQENYLPKELPKESKFSKFLIDTLPDITFRNLIQEYYGYTFLNHCNFEKFLVMEGEGSNGKSVMINILKALHRKSANIQLGNMSGNGMLAEIQSASLLFASEIPKHINEELLKQIISGEGIAIKTMLKNIMTVYTTAKLIVAQNQFPILGDKSNGVYRRLILIPFDNVIKDTDPKFNPNLSDEIIAEELGLVLDWCLLGLERLLKRGRFDIPEKIKEATQQKMVLNNNVRQFFQEVEFVIGDIEQCPILKEDVFTEYKEWCSSNGYKAMNSSNFWIETHRIYGKGKIADKRISYEGVRRFYTDLTRTTVWLKWQEEKARQDDPFAKKERNDNDKK